MKRIKLTALVFIVALVSATVVRGQVTTAQLNGTVVDQHGAVIANAEVQTRNRATGASLSTTTDDSGRYLLTNLVPGDYEVTISAPGFSTQLTTLPLTVGEAATLRVELKVGAASETVTVEAASSIIEPTRTDIGQAVETRAIASLPIGNRNFVDFVLLSPNVAVGRGDVGGGAFQEPNSGVGVAAASRLTFGGQHDKSNLIQVDGLDAVQTVTGLQRAVPSQEAVREFRVLNSTYTAELGRSISGFVNVITKSGTNSIHGSAYYFGMNDALNARNILERPETKVLRQNQFGVAIGGPIKKDRLFYFGNYEGQRRAEGNQFAQVLLNNLAAINGVRRRFNLRPETDSLLRTNDYNAYFTRLDWQATPKHQLAFTYNLLDSTTLGFLGGGGRAAAASSTARDNFVTDQTFGFNAISVLSSHWVNEARFQWARRSFDFPTRLNEPALEIPNLIIMGKSTSDPDFYRETRLQWADNTSHTKGSHTIKFGGDVGRLSDQATWKLFFPARILFAGLPGFLGLPPFTGPTAVIFQWPVGLNSAQAPALPTDWSRSVPPELEPATKVDIPRQIYGFFVQDQWRATPKLTLNYGLRYDVDHLPAQFEIKSDRDNWQPRVGLAYAVNSRVVFRSGFGLFHDVSRRVPFHWLTALTTLGFRGPTPVRALENFTSINSLINFLSLPGPPRATPAAFTLLNTGQFPASAVGLPFVLGIIRNLPTSYGVQGSAELSIALRKDLALSANYLFVGGRHLPGLGGNLNALRSAGLRAGGKPLFAGRVDPSQLLVAPIIKSGLSSYHGGTLTLSKRFSRDFSFDTNYTFSKTIDNNGQGWGGDIADIWEDPTNRGLERALSNQHVAHRFVFSLLAESPKDWNMLLRDFTFSSIVRLQSPRYFTIYVGSDLNGDGNPLNDRPGLLGRNTLKGDNLRQVDFRLSRKFKLSERFQLEPSIDFLNAFNTVNVRDLTNVFGSDVLTNTPAEGFQSPKSVSPARQIQYAVRISF